MKKNKNRYERVEREYRQVGGYYPANGMQPMSPSYNNGIANGPIVNSMPDVPGIRMMDENGRVFQPVTYFGPLPSNGPVAIPIPSTIVQTTPIVTPISIVPYATQNQPLWQYDIEDDSNY